MKFCDEDEVRINPDKINHLYFDKFNEAEDANENKVNITKLLKTRAVILESDFDKHIKCYELKDGIRVPTGKKGEWTYFVEFKGGLNLKTWFLESELLLI